MIPFVNIHTHHKTTDETIISVINQYPKELQDDILYYSIGIHPWFIKKESLDDEYRILKTALVNKNCIAIGECGLDKLTATAFELQKEVFVKQLVLAKKYKKPLIIHCVKAFDELILIRKKYPEVKMIIHGFTKNNKLSKQLQNQGFYLSFGKQLLKNKMLLTGIDISKLFFETDDALVDIKTIYKAAAKQLNVSLPKLKKQVYKNFKAVLSDEY